MIAKQYTVGLSEVSVLSLRMASMAWWAMNEYRLDGEFANTTNHVSFIFLDFLYLKSILLCFLILFDILFGAQI